MMQRMRCAGWWAAAIGAGTVFACVVAVQAARAISEGGSGSYVAGRIFGALIVALLVGALLTLALFKLAKPDPRWRLPAVLAISAAVGVLAIGGQVSRQVEANSSCEDVSPVSAARLVPASYQARATSKARVKALLEQAGLGELTADAVQTTRRGTVTTMITLNSATQALKEEEVYRGFVDGAGTAEPVSVGRGTGRLARQQGTTAILGSAGRCAFVLLVGLDEGATQALAADLTVE